MPPTEPDPGNPPDGWGDDGVSSFLDMAHRNTLANYVNHRAEYSRLVEIEQAFTHLNEGLYNNTQIHERLLFNRAHCSFHAACRTSLAGQFTDTFPHIRLLLETACYANHIRLNSAAAAKWKDRNDSLEDLKKCRSEFTWRNVRRSIESCAPEVATRVVDLYEFSIDIGAHPNQLGVFSVLEFVREDGDVTLDQACLTDDQTLTRAALRTVAKGGVGALYVFAQVFPERCRLLGMVESLERLRSGL